MEYTLDENGKIIDTDKLYAELSGWHNEDKYENIINKIISIPREKWSVKLQFRLIGAYNNLKRFDEARRELEDIAPRCQTPAHKARFFYMNGYICYTEDMDMAALSFYKKGLSADPENTSKLNLDNEVKECGEYIQTKLSELGELSEEIYNALKAACMTKPESEKADVGKEVFTMYLGYLPAMRRFSSDDKGMGTGDYLTKYEGKRKSEVLKVLSVLGITDRDSMIKFYQNNLSCNMSRLYNAIPLYLAGKPAVDVSKLNEESRELYFDSVEFFKPFNKYLPRGGISAWDLSEKIGILRLSYSCDILPENDYREAMEYLSGEARKLFSSFEEFMISMTFGCGVWRFHLSNRNISSAMDYMRSTVQVLLGSGLPYVKWLK